MSLPTNRRTLLKTLVATAIGSSLPGQVVFAGEPAIAGRTASPAGTAAPIPWRNWSGSQHSLPSRREAPASLGALQQLLRDTDAPVRPVGSGHSFSPLVPTDDILLSVNRLNGILSHDTDSLQATIAAGTRLGQIGGPLEALGQALRNMPDIDQQTLAGSLSTATHGTGATLPCMSDFITGVQLVTADGELLECDSNHHADVFQAAKVGLGALGIITAYRLQNTSPYKLRKVTEWQAIEDILDEAEANADRYRNFEFFYIPFSGMGFTETHEITDDPVSATARFDQNDGADTLRKVRNWLEWSPRLRRLVLSSYMKTLGREEKVASSWQTYTSDRNVRFNEMEYHLPRELGLQAFREIRALVEQRFPEVFFPFEVRYVKGDDIWLSPFYQQDSISIAVHRFHEEDHAPLFQAVEPIFRKYHGRPHWGKMNTLKGEDFRRLYPHWDDFAAVRQMLDPDGRFLNPYLKGLFA
ncbi:MAG: FAD-binding protein [Marinobacter sp.]|nr:FAD-binding protein [Marinobacter sp.]